MSIPGRHDAVPTDQGGGGGFEKRIEMATEPTREGAFSDDGVDLTLIRWTLRQSPIDRLRAAQSLIDAIWAFRNDSET